MLSSTLLIAAAKTERIIVEGGSDFWQTAIVAVLAALLGSVVGGITSFRANVLLDDRRREARTKLRRKSKVYTPIRLELKALQDSRSDESHSPYGLIPRESTPGYGGNRASLYLWKELTEDGRSLTAASTGVISALDEVDSLADSFNDQRAQTVEVFERRGNEIVRSLGAEPEMTYWVNSDLDNLMEGDMADLSLLRRMGSKEPSSIQADFELRWASDTEAISAREDLLDVDRRLGEAITDAIAELETSMRKISRKYENESAED